MFYVLCVESKGSSIYLVINWSTAHATQNSTQTNVHLFKFSEYEMLPSFLEYRYLYIKLLT